MDRLRDKIVLITGATSEIAQACRDAALAEGAAAVIMTGHDDDKGRRLLGEDKDRCFYQHLDVTHPDDWKRVVDWIEARYGCLHVLVHNAGITGTKLHPSATDLEHTSLESWRAVIQTDLDGIFLGCREAIRLMKRSGSGAIVNIGSRSGLVGRPDRLAYAAAKAAVQSLTKSVAMYCADQGLPIRCNAVLPSCIMTSMWEPVLGAGESFNHDLYRKISEKIPMKRFGLPEEVAKAVIFLASDDASYITGAELIIDGGAQAKDALRD